MTYALNRYNSGVLTSSNQFNTGGRLPWVEHRVVREKPLVWQPHSIYFIKPDNEEVSEHYWVDASGIPHQVGDAAFTAWKALAGNGAKTIHDFVAAVLASINPMIPAANVVSGVLDPLRIPPHSPWGLAANNASIAIDGKYILTDGNTLVLTDIGQGNQCWIKLVNIAQSWLLSGVEYSTPDLTWSIPQVPDPGPNTIMTIVCDSAAKKFTFHG